MNGTTPRNFRFLLSFFVVPVFLSVVLLLLIERAPAADMAGLSHATVETDINIHAMINALAVWLCPIVAWIAGPLAYTANGRLDRGRHRVAYYAVAGALVACATGFILLGPGSLTLLLPPYDPVFLLEVLLWFGHAAVLGTLYAVTVRLALEWFELIGPWNPEPAV